MKALTLMQPWATLIAIGAKRIETRKWHPRENPGIIAIASSQKPLSAKLRALCETPEFRHALPYGPLPHGSIVAVGHIGEFLPTEAVGPDELEREGCFGDYSEGRWAWFFDDVIPLAEPIPIPPSRPGEKKAFRLNLWEVPKAIITPELTGAVRKVEDRAKG